MTLQSTSLEWAIDFVAQHSDGDLMPQMSEIAALVGRKADFVKKIAGQQLTSFSLGVCRRFIVPKDEISYQSLTTVQKRCSPDN